MIPFLPSFLGKLRNFFCCLPFLFLVIFVIYLTQKGTFSKFYQLPSIPPSLPSIGDVVSDKQFSVKIERVEKIKNTANVQSDFETIHVQGALTTSLPVPVAVFSLFDIWVEDSFANKFTISPNEPRNDALSHSEVPPASQLTFDVYFTTPKYSQELTLVMKPKIGGDAIRIKL
jgi:hypothetical protein